MRYSAKGMEKDDPVWNGIMEGRTLPEIKEQSNRRYKSVFWPCETGQVITENTVHRGMSMMTWTINQEIIAQPPAQGMHFSINGLLEYFLSA